MVICYCLTKQEIFIAKISRNLPKENIRNCWNYNQCCDDPCVVVQVSQWYELVVFTASMEIYGAAVADKLDRKQGMLKRRYYRQVIYNKIQSSQQVVYCSTGHTIYPQCFKKPFCKLFYIKKNCDENLNLMIKKEGNYFLTLC